MPAAEQARGNANVINRWIKTTRNLQTTSHGPGFVLSLMVLSGSLIASAAKGSEKTFESDPNPRITLTNISGQVVIRGWDKPQVRVVYEVMSPRVEVDTELLPAGGSAASRFRFATHVLDPLVTGKDETVDYSLDVPAGASLEIRNPQGSVQLARLQGGDVSVESVGGSIAVSDFNGHLFLRSVGGNIEAIRPNGRVEAYSITGSLHIVSPATSKLRGTTTSGRILFEGDFADGGEYSLSAYSGDIDIFCPPSASFELNAKTVRGKLENEMPMTIRHRQATPLSSANSLFGTRNTGKATLNLTSFSGKIRIRER